MTDTVGTVILGFAHGHVDAYCTLWRARPELGVRLIAGWDADAARAGAACRKHGLDQAATLADALARPDARAVVIGAETAYHAELVEAAAAAGKAIVLQKPAALSLAEADRIVAAVARAGVPFTLAWQMRADPENLKMKELLADGRFGRLYMLRRRHCLPAHRWKGFETSWHVNPALNRDLFADDAAHPIDFFYWLLGLPRSVMAEMGTLRNPAMPNDNAIVVFRYADGSFAEVSCTFAAPAGELTTEIVCERGLIVQQYGDLVSSLTPRAAGGVALKWHLEGEPGWTVDEGPGVQSHGERISGLAAPLADFLRGARPPLATAREGRDVLRMTLACYEAAETGRRVEF